MKILSKVCFVLSGFGLIFDSMLMILDKPNPLGFPLPCPITLIILAIGLISFGFLKSE
jgi:hypothetical protein